MKRVITIIILLALTVINLYSEDRQFYFVGKYGRLGSISQDANTQNGIYLRWDLIEGDFPQDISRIKLIRVDDNKTLLDIGSNDIMSSNEITQMFLSNGSQRRLFEIINAISKNNNPNCTNANISNIGDRVRSCLEDKTWSFLASRVNFDIARARYRAYLDTSYDKTKSFISYKLVGIEGTNEILLGKTTIYPQEPQSVLGAKDFKQIIESRCNDNRYGLDDYRVGLSWKNGGENITEFFANGLMVSGYDIYYSTKPANLLPKNYPESIDIATIASKITHNSIGELDNNILQQYNLAKANETLITIGEKDTDGKKPIYLESMETLKNRGFKPGESRYYFLVPRDFTGNYGETVYIKVVIPDLLKPAKPINPRTVEDNKTMSLIWDSVTPSNYIAYHENMKACPNRIGNRITFIEKDKNCSNSEGITLNFNINRYLVYRFDNNKDAVSFEDKNLNGIDDIKEELNATTCQAEKIVSSKYNHLVSTIPSSNNKIIKFRDSTIKEAKEYWYKIVSVTENNITSQSTMPIRAFIPKRELIKAPKIRIGISEKDFIDNTTPIDGNCVMLFTDQEYFDNYIKDKKVCMEVSVAIGNGKYKVDEYCDNMTYHQFCTKETSTDPYHLNVSLHYDNGLMSYPRHLTIIPNRGKLPPPNKPSLDNFKVDIASKKVSIDIKPQIEKVTGTMLYLYNSDKNISQIQMIPHIDKHNPEELINVEINLEINLSSINVPDTLCIKGKTIGLDGNLSSWSNPLCKDLSNSPIVEEEDLLAWPKLTNNAIKGDDFNITFENNQTKIKLKDLYKNSNCEYLYNLGSIMNFIVYRSTILPNGEQGNFIQVSPLINRPEKCIDTEVFTKYDNLEYYNSDSSDDKYTINFVDKYPYIAGEKYQYVLLFFNEDGEVSSYSLTSPRVIQTH